MKYNVLADDQIVNKRGPVSLDEATEIVKTISGRMALGAFFAKEQNNQELKLKNISTRESLKIVEAKDEKQ